MAELRNVELLKDLSIPLIKKLESGGYKGTKKSLSKDIDDLVKAYNEKAVGENKGETIT